MAEIKSCSQEDIESLRLWFQEYEAEFPKSMDLLPGVVINDVATTIKRYFSVYDYTKGESIFRGQISHLYLIKEKLQEMGIG